MDPDLTSGARTRVRRLPDKQVQDRSALDAVLDAGRVAHVAVLDGQGQPYVLPVAYARHDDAVLVHGSTGSRLFRSLADGAPTCLTVSRPSVKELAATLVLSLPLVEWSLKVSAGPPDDAADDLGLPVWAGVLPLREAAGRPWPAPGLREDVPLPGYVGLWCQG